MATGPAPQTIGDVIAAKKTADSHRAAAQAAAASADTALTAAQQATVDADATLKVDLAAIGPVFLANPDGSVEIWMPDTSEAGFHSFSPTAASTPLPAAPTPTPAPVTSPTPTPAPPTPAPPTPAPPTPTP